MRLRDICLLFAALFVSIVSVQSKGPTISKKSKLCGNPTCTDVLFTVKVQRTMNYQDPRFISTKEGDVINVHAIKFSDRFDIMDGTNQNNGRGLFFNGAIEKGPYVEFLHAAVTGKKQMFIISQDSNDIGDKAQLGTLQADQELVRDYNAQARAHAAASNLPAPEELPVPQPVVKGHGHSHGGHGHSHGGHGHSHEAGHGHSHEAGDAHAHSHEEPTQAPPAATTPAPVEAEQQEAVTLQVVPTATPAPVAAAAETVPEPVPAAAAAGDMDAEIEAMLKRDQELLEQAVAEQKAAEEKALAEADRLATEQAAKEEADKKLNEEAERLAAEEQRAKHEAELKARQEEEAAAKAAEQLAAKIAEEKRIAAEAETAKAALDAEQLMARLQAEKAAAAHADADAAAAALEQNKVDEAAIPVPMENALPAESLVVSEEKKMEGGGDIEFPTMATPLGEAPQERVPRSADPVVNAAEAAAQQNTVVEEGYCDRDDCEKVQPLPAAAQPVPPVETVQTTPPVPVAQPVIPETEAVLTEEPTSTVAPETEQQPGVEGEEEAVPADPHPATPASEEETTTTLPPAQPTQHSPPLPDIVDMEAIMNGRGGAVPEDIPAYLRSPPPNVSTGDVGALGSLVQSAATVVRTVVPGCGQLDDAGVGMVLNMAFVLGAIVIHLVSYFLSDNGETEQFERRAAQDLATKCRQLQETIKQKDEEIRRAGAMGGRSQADTEKLEQLMMENGTLKLQLKQATERLQSAEAEASRERSEKEQLEAARQSERESAGDAVGRANEAERLARQLHDELSAVSAELASTKSALDRIGNELQDERRRTDELSSSVASAKEEAEKSNEAVVCVRSELSNAVAEKERVEMEMGELSALCEELQRGVRQAEQAAAAHRDELVVDKNGEAESGGGSGGWSDMEDWKDDDEKVEKEVVVEKARPLAATVPAAPSTDILELARLRAQLRDAEQQYKTAKASLERESSERERVERRLADVETELNRKMKELDEREQQKNRADEHADGLLQLMKEEKGKLKETEATCERLRDEVAKWRSEVDAISEEKRKKEERIRDLDADLKKLRNEHLKLETKHFHDVRDLTHRLKEAESARAAASDLFNVSAASSMERDAAPSRGAAGGGPPVFESLWDEPVLPASAGGRVSRTLPDDQFGQMPLIKKNSRSRRSDRFTTGSGSGMGIGRAESPSDGGARDSTGGDKRKKEGSVRRRSRSHGRQPMQPMGGMVPGGYGMGMGMGYGGMPAMPGMPAPGAYQDMMGMGYPGELNRRHSKSGHVYYSSGGSNGGRSPPPEMPLLGAVPPPGLRKPASKRATADLGADLKSS